MNHATTIISIAIGILIASIILSTSTWEVQEEETYITYKPYTYEQSVVRVQQVRKLLIFQVTQAQYMVKNTDIQDGKFTLNFIFDNGTETKTSTKKVDILAGEKKAITVDSPLHGKSTITLNIVPPNKEISQERTVTKTVNGWDYVGRFIIRLVLK